MSYKNVEHTHIVHPVLSKIFLHADAFLRDCYGMLQPAVKDQSRSGNYAFSIVLILLCVIDGISAEVYPTRRVKKQEDRFKKLIRCKLYWGRGEKWIDKSEAANLLYLEYRNPLVHELGREKASRVRRSNFGEPVVGSWGTIPTSQQDIDYVDSLQTWDDNWPTMYERTSGGEIRNMKLCAAALYWSVKKMIEELAGDCAVIREAEKYQNSADAPS